MNILMAGVDYRSASIEARETIGFSQEKVKEILRRIKQNEDVSGAVILSTCNRTEVYLSFDSTEAADPVELFCDAAEISDDMKKYFYIKKGERAAVYLFELASGIHSMIFGDDQIVTQVKDAIRIAMENGSSDAKLNTLFRCAITCAKKVKTNFVLSAVSPSVAGQSARIVCEYLMKNRDSKALVIGNGVVGRSVCEELVKQGCQVYMTTRKHNSQSTVVPKGCKTIAFDEREAMISKVDILISATSSPHQTITADMVDRCERKPRYIIDLAVPRDIDPEVKNIENVLYYNVDSLGETALKDNSKEIAALKVLIKEHMEDYNQWSAHRERLFSGQSIKYRVGEAI